MPYKIVQTLEGKKTKLTVVASEWEKDNILKYPKKGISKYLNDEHSLPEPDWDVMMCSVKRKNISSYEDGEMILTDMLTRSDTDDGADHNSKKRHPVLKNQEALNLNILAEKKIKTRCPQPKESTARDTMMDNVYFENPPQSSTDTIIAEVSPDNVYTVPYETNNPAEVQESISIDIDYITGNQKQMLEYQREMLEQQRLMLDNQGIFFCETTETQKQLIENSTAMLGPVLGIQE